MKHFLIPVLALALTGCASFQQESRKPPELEPEAWQPPPLPEAEEQQVQHGSLFSASYSNSLYEDRMAYRVGDILTVLLDEETKSRASSGTNFKKDSSVNGPRVLWFGSRQPDTSMSMDRSFDGSGATRQENMLDGSITVSVLKVLPNRTLLVRGEKWLTLNQGDEYIRVSGILRPEDITQSNTVSSQRLANARLVYSGEGPIADANEAGWLTRFFNSPAMPL